MTQNDYDLIRQAEWAGETDAENRAEEYTGHERDAYMRGRGQRFRAMGQGAPSPPLLHGMGPRMNDRQMKDADDDRYDQDRYDDWAAEKNL